MNGAEYKRLLWVLFLLVGLLAPKGLWAESATGEVQKTQAGAIVIKSKRLEIDDQGKIVTFEGDVNAQKDDFDIDCQKMVVHYTDLPSGSKKRQTESRIQKIVAVGQVKINRASGGEATAEKAVYLQKEEKLILTGKPTVRQGSDVVEGDQITIFLKDNRSVVESDQDNKVRAIIFPKR